MSDKNRISPDDDPRRDIDRIADDAEADLAARDADPLGVARSDPTPDEALGGAHDGTGAYAAAGSTASATATRTGPRGMGHIAEHDSDDWWRTWLGRTTAVLGGVLVLATALIWAWVGGLTNPAPRDVPVAIISGDATSAGVLAALRAQTPAIQAITYATAADAGKALTKRKVDAVLASDATGLRGGLNLTIAGAAGPGVPETVTNGIGAAASALSIPLTIEDVHPLSEHDPRGVAPFYIVLGWIIGGLLAAVVLGVALGTVPRDLDRLGMRLGALAAFSLALGLLGALFAGPFLNVWSTHTFGLWMCGALITMTAALIASALQSWLGLWGVGLSVLLLLVLGVPGSGGSVAPELLPRFFRGMHRWIPNGLGTDLVRGVEYFGRNANAWPIVGLALWCLGSVLALVGATAVLGRHAREAAGLGRSAPTPPATDTPAAAPEPTSA